MSTTRRQRQRQFFFPCCLLLWFFSSYCLLLTTASLPSSLLVGSTTSKAHKHQQHTRLSGYGSRNSKKSIFYDKSTDEGNSANSTLWVQKTSTGELRFKCQNSVNQTTTVILQNKNSTNNGSLVLQCNESLVDDDSNNTQHWTPISGIYGVYKVPSGMIWVLIVQTECVYDESNLLMNIHRVQSLELLHISHNNNNNTSQSSFKEEARQVRLLRHALRHHEFYCCMNPTTGAMKDCTHTWQRIMEYKNHTTDWWKQHSNNNTYRPDSRFFWNEPAIQPLLQQQNIDVLLQHVIPVTSMFVGIQRNIPLTEELSYDQLLLSRRSRYRAGTRFTKRGADSHGHVANYAETEQVVFLRNHHNNTLLVLLSHVQTRGSIPLRWSSPADVKTYRPRVRIGTDPLAQGRAVKLHLQQELNMYSYGNMSTYQQPKVVFVNLIDKKKDQGRLGRAFDAVLQAVVDVYTTEDSSSSNITTTTKHYWRLAPNTVKHVWYDFHAQVKNGRWDRLGSLLKELTPVLEEHGYLCVLLPEQKVISTQHGVVRTNCMDCLDRTNVVQSLFGRFMLYRQLSECGHYATNNNKRRRSLPLEYTVAFRRNSLTLPWTEGEKAHRFLWADNADAISRLYAGTPALKGDFTRTGKRTKRGALDDGMNSLQRYYLNNFLDADRQEGMDLMVGHAEFSTDSSHVWQDATRSILLGAPSSSEDERHHVLLQSPEELFGKRLRSKGGATSTMTSQPRLGLRWLPGDLQSHMKSHASGVLSETQRALLAMDRRAASDVPWWVSSSDDDSSEDDADRLSLTATTSTTSTGYIIGCLVAAMQAPTTTAATIVVLMGLAAAAKRADSQKGEP